MPRSRPSARRHRHEDSLILIPRLHLFELEDLQWFPTTIRDLATDYLHFMERRFRLHEPVVPLLQEVLDETGCRQVVDLCSGGGGPIPALQQALASVGPSVHFTLTDRYPNLAAFEQVASDSGGAITYLSQPIDARAVPNSMKGVRTIFNSFHHFQPTVARAILREAMRARQPIAIFEIPERSVSTLIPLLLTPLVVWLATPWMRPFRWGRLLWTYAIPLVPLTCWWDGIVSQLRAYSPAELEALVAPLTDGGYVWKVGKVPIRSTIGHVTYLIGLPEIRAEHAV